MKIKRLVLMFGMLSAALIIIVPFASNGQLKGMNKPFLQKTEERIPSTQKRLMVIDDYIQIRSVRDPQLSPKGDLIAYTVTVPYLKKEKKETRIWVAPFDGKSKTIPYTSKGHSSSQPRWDPTGRYLAFMSARGDGETQVYTLFRKGGEAMQLTDVRQGVENFVWSPDGSKMALVIKDPSPEDIAAEKAEKEGKKYVKPKVPEPHVIDRLQFKLDYEGYLDRRRTHIYVLDIKSRKLLQVTSGDYDDFQPTWSPDGRFIAFVSNRTDAPDTNYNQDIWVVASDSPDKGKNLIQVTTNPGEDGSPAWSPDGKWITHYSKTDVDAIVFATEHLAVSSSTGEQTKILTEKLGRRISEPCFSNDGQSIYFIVEDEGKRHLARIPASGGNIERVIDGKVSVGSFTLGSKKRIGALVSKPNLPGEIFVQEKTSELRKLTTLNDELISELKLATVEKACFKSSDGTEIESFFYKPPSFNPEMKYPTILWIHGGPDAQYEFNFDFLAQLFCANGYFVVMPNPRGSSGYGQDFTLEIFADWGNKDYQDVMAAVDYAIEQKWADPDRLGVGGWSYGGILTNYVITKTDRFEGAVSGASLALFACNYGHDQYQRWYEKEFGLPWENRELWERLSPYNKVEKIVTPTLIMGGAVDWNVPIINSEQLYMALKRLGRTTKLVVYPDEHHGLEKLANQKDRYERYLAWYDKYVKGIETED